MNSFPCKLTLLKKKKIMIKDTKYPFYCLGVKKYKLRYKCFSLNYVLICGTPGLCFVFLLDCYLRPGDSMD